MARHRVFQPFRRCNRAESIRFENQNVPVSVPDSLAVLRLVGFWERVVILTKNEVADPDCTRDVLGSAAVYWQELLLGPLATASEANPRDHARLSNILDGLASIAPLEELPELEPSPQSTPGEA